MSDWVVPFLNPPLFREGIASRGFGFRKMNEGAAFAPGGPLRGPRNGLDLTLRVGLG